MQALLPYFITVANGPVHIPTVAHGNEAVLRARFEDAAFFYREDLKQKLEDFRPKLRGTMFQKDLGSLYDKVSRAVSGRKVLLLSCGPIIPSQVEKTIPKRVGNTFYSVI